jgi:Adenylate and Guanylate cyclase catalytic domain
MVSCFPNALEVLEMLSVTDPSILFSKDAVFSPFGTSFSVMTGTPTNENLDGRNPQSIVAQPVFKTLKKNSTDIVGFLFTLVEWEKFLVNLLPTGVNGICAVLKNSCGQSITYLLYGGDVIFLGASDIHDSKYDKAKISFEFDENYLSSSDILRGIEGHCYVFVDLYPTDTYEESVKSPIPIILSCVIGAIFVGTILVFLFYDSMVESRNRKVINVAARANAFIVSLYPKTVAQRLLSDKDKSNNDHTSGTMSHRNDGENRQTTIRGYLRNGEKNASMYNVPISDRDHNGEFYTTKPIADLFPDCTVMFADIVGFTAWSSSREPAQVFVLLETIYHAFDYIAMRRRVFKVRFLRQNVFIASVMEFFAAY